jgi:PAS domain S-box-containing protein
MDDKKTFTSLINLPFQFVVVFLIFATGIGAAGYRYYHYAKEHLENESRKDLTVIADLKIDEITKWREERLGDANLVFKNPFIPPAIHQWLQTGSPDLKEKIVTFMKSLEDQIQYKSILLLDEKGDIRLTIPADIETLGPDAKRLVSEALRSKQVVLSDLYISKLSDTIRLTLAVPLLITKKDGTVPVGVFLLRIDPYRFLFPLIQSWPAPSDSAETLLVRREGDEVVFLNELRHRKNTALKLRFKISEETLPAAMALKGTTGIVEGLDYRGVPVLAALRPVPDSPWFLVSKVDKQEIYSPLVLRAWVLLALVLLLLTVTGLGLLFIWHRRGLEITRKERDKAQQYLDIAAVMFLAINADQKVILINRKGCELLGYQEKEIIGMDWFDTFLPEKIRKEAKDVFAKLMCGEVSPSEYFENPILTKNGEERFIAFHNTIIRDESGTIIGTLSSGADITEHKQAVETIQQERAFSESVINSLPGIFYIFDEQGKFLLWNRNFEDMSEYAASEIKNMTPLDFFPDDEKQFMSERIQQVFLGGHADAEGHFTSKSGRQTPYYFTGLLYKINDKPHLLGMGMDMTEIKTAQEAVRKTMMELERSNKELEQFAYIASHDLQEPLRMVSSYVQLLAQRYKGRFDADADDFIHYAVDGAVRMQTMINDLLAYSRVGTRGKPFGQADCDAILKQVLVGLKFLIEESGALITSDPLPVIMADPSQLLQVFQNLISNAIKFRGEKTPEIYIRAERKGNEWVFSVSDNGIGFEEKYGGKIFDIFKRLHTASKYPGSGIGLTICRKIVERHKGRIWAESEPGKGSKFYFALPTRHEE